ncbi:MAG: toll/interleukin-1 receptor domain-containing protein, partial [Clostridia bacterium]
GQDVKTDDYHLGYQIYNDLGKNGYKVFFSPESLKGKGGENYEPLIFNALDTSAVMLTLCTENKDYLNTTWVKNEWSRFVELMERNENKKLIPIFKKTAKMSIDDLPQEFVDKKLQALDSASYDFSTSLLRSIQNARSGFFRGIGGTVKRKDIKNKTGFNMDIKLETRKLEKKKFEQTQAAIVIPQKMENLLRMANTPLEAGKYAKAYELFENILKDDPNQYLALWGKILCHTSCTTQENFSLWGALRLTDFESLDRLLTIAPTDVAKSYYNDYLNSFLEKCDSKGLDFDKAY